MALRKIVDHGLRHPDGEGKKQKCEEEVSELPSFL